MVFTREQLINRLEEQGTPYLVLYEELLHSVAEPEAYVTLFKSYGSAFNTPLLWPLCKVGAQVKVIEPGFGPYIDETFDDGTSMLDFVVSSCTQQEIVECVEQSKLDTPTVLMMDGRRTIVEFMSDYTNEETWPEELVARIYGSLKGGDTNCDE